MCVKELGRHAKCRMSLDLKISVSVEESMFLAGICKIITYIQKCKNEQFY